MLLYCRHPGGVLAFRPPQILGYSRAIGLASKATRRHSERSLPVLLFIRRVCCDGCRQTQSKNLSSIERAAKIYVQERSLARVAPLGRSRRISLRLSARRRFTSKRDPSLALLR